MALGQRKRQPKLERRKAKQKAKKSAIAPRGMHDVLSRFERAAAVPILHCAATAELWDEGIGSVLISRQLPHDHVAVAAFLVDRYCLGVKDALANITTRRNYDCGIYEKIHGGREVVRLTPQCARNLVEGAVRYAADLGFPAHPDYRMAKLIFGDIDPTDCPQQFVYGQNGKPFFIAGPYDSPSRCRDILDTLHRRCGPDGYHYLVPLNGP